MLFSNISLPVQMHLCFISRLSGLYHFLKKGVKHLSAPSEEDWRSLPVLLLCCWWVTDEIPSRCSRVTHYDNNIQIKYGKETCTVQVEICIIYMLCVYAVDNMHMSWIICICTPYLKLYPITFLCNILFVEITN